MGKKTIEAEFYIRKNLSELHAGELWKLFTGIGAYWEASKDDLDKMRSDFLTFISNRILLNGNYLNEYVSAIDLLKRMAVEVGYAAAVKKLLTDPQANIFPPSSDLSRARQFVSNEFVTLFVSLGGMKAIDESFLNCPGYIAGPNNPERPPYHVYDENNLR